jgi:hypothetical protein
LGVSLIGLVRRYLEVVELVTVSCESAGEARTTNVEPE